MSPVVLNVFLFMIIPTISLITHAVSLSLSILVADDLRLLPVSGCVPLRVHTVTPQSAAGAHQAANAAMLRTQVTHAPEGDLMPPKLPLNSNTR